jgi:DNA-binding transcriptional ArsR family regulator
MRWFRFYDDAVDDPKVQSLPAELFKTWVNLLCIASKNGGVIPYNYSQLAFRLRKDKSQMEKHLTVLIEAGLMDQGETLHPHNWSGRQYESDSSATRVKRYRERKRNVTGNATSNVTPTVNVTPPEAETDAEPETEQKQSAPPPVIPGCHERYSEVCQAVLEILGPNAVNLNRVDKWLKDGCDPDLDIYPTLKRRRANWSGSGLIYFDGAIADAKATRTRPMPEGQAKSQFFDPSAAAARLANRGAA